jgi:uncharacterized membrane protein
MSSPLKPTLKTELLPILAVIVCVVASFYFFPRFPDRIAIHWNFHGQPDNWGDKSFGAFFFPFLIAAIYIMFLVLPYFDPKKERYQEFAKTYHLFKSLIVLFMALIYLATGLFNIGYPINIGVTTSLGVGALFIIIGNYLGKIKYNWFVGIRTPWTMSSENVWNKTHRVGGWLFVTLGIIMMIIPHLPESLAIPIFILGIVAVVAGSFGYSYWLFRQERKIEK